MKSKLIRLIGMAILVSPLGIAIGVFGYLTWDPAILHDLAIILALTAVIFGFIFTTTKIGLHILKYDPFKGSDNTDGNK